ncbi:hypothetical protein DXG03_009733 [Asterophora parasitica]|uniref:F-box domain-containing protein n=1 Tax=Asterophora parasitica TaxID=117018 RepID=A0A9P7FY61_9AGAR|nr:hypothetical protein DXG03_009733 [Asterophora parasitica]
MSLIKLSYSTKPHLPASKRVVTGHIHTLPAILDEEFHRDAGVSRSTLSLTAVCRPWQDIALATNELWTHVAFQEPRCTYLSRYATCDGITSWFSRTDPSAALSFSLTFTTKYGSRYNSIWPKELTQTLAWQNLPIVENRIIPLHRLVKMHIDTDLLPYTIANALRACPNLTHLYIGATPDSAVELILVLRNLVELVLHAGYILTDDDDGTNPVNYTFPGRTEVPALRKLAIFGNPAWKTDFLLARFMFDSLIRSQATITHLILDELSFNAFELFGFLRADFHTLEYHSVVREAWRVRRVWLSVRSHVNEDAENYPFVQEGLRQLEVLNVTLGNAENWPAEKASRNAAKALLRAGLELEYPNLGVSSKTARESEEEECEEEQGSDWESDESDDEQDDSEEKQTEKEQGMEWEGDEDSQQNDQY